MRSRLPRLLPLVGAMLVCAAPALGAQGLALAAGVGAQTMRLVRSQAPDAPLEGLTAQLFGSIAVGKVALEASYAQGSLSPAAGAIGTEDLVDGELMAVVRPRPWLALGVGPRLRALVSDAGTERWTRFEARVGVAADLVEGRLRAYADYWSALSAEVNTTAGGDGAAGARVGLTLDIANSPFALQLFYAVDRARFRNDRDEVLEGVGLSLTLRRD